MYCSGNTSIEPDINASSQMIRQSELFSVHPIPAECQRNTILFFLCHKPQDIQKNCRIRSLLALFLLIASLIVVGLVIRSAQHHECHEWSIKEVQQPRRSQRLAEKKLKQQKST